MNATDCYQPTDEEIALFSRVKEYVNQHRGRFVESAAELDRDYSSRSIRHRQAVELSKERNDPKFLCRTRVADRRRGLDVAHRIPPRRQRDGDGVWQPPLLPLVKCFELAWSDSFDEPASLDVMPWAQREAVALRRVLLAWLRYNPDRGKRPWLTAFQQMVTVATEDGRPPSYREDDEPVPSPDTLWIRRDGRLEPDAPHWIAAVRAALTVLEGKPENGLIAHAVKIITAAHERLVCLEEVPARNVEPDSRGELARRRDQCISVLREAQRRVTDVRMAHGSEWTPQLKEDVGRLEYALDAMARGLRTACAVGWTHPVPRLGGANEDACRVWAEHEDLMIQMINFLPTLDYGESATTDTGGTADIPTEDETGEGERRPRNDGQAEAPPAFSRSERLVLLAMSNIDASVLASLPAISDATPDDDPVGERTTGEAIKKLIKLDFVERPHGPKGGARLTTSGRQLARRLREDWPNTAG